jgi:hypothetical protein
MIPSEGMVQNQMNPFINIGSIRYVANDPRLKKINNQELALFHRSGLSNWRWKMLMKILSFKFEPGTKYSYSGEVPLSI